MTRSIGIALGVIAFAPAIAQAQSYGSLDEIVVTSGRNDDRVESPLLVLEHDMLQELQPVAAADVFRNVMGISLRTNSRGESVIRVRGAEERQTLIFLDGAPLATPWDGRADLALLPAGLIDRVEITRGAAPIEYGANAVAGVVDLSTFVPDQGWNLRAEAQQGSLGLDNLNLVGGFGLENGWSFVAGASRIERDAERIADRASVAFDPSTTRARTNTDMAGNSIYAATAYEGGAGMLRLSVLHADVERGVAAQGDLDPATTSPRFWRTPEWRLTQATLNGTWNIRQNLGLRVAGWRQWFDQTIDAYTDYSYTALRAREEGRDDTTGARVALSLDLSRATLRLVGTTQESTHRQIEAATDTGAADDFVYEPRLRYRQRLATAGAEIDVPFSAALTSTFGFAVDHAATPLTGDKPPQKSLSANSWSAGLRWTPSEQWVTAATIGERSRFPTPRELYGAALGRFLLNPDLRPERSLLADLSVKHSPSDALSLDFAVWANDSDDTLSQRVVEVDGVNRRQRYNTDGSFTYGIEAAATIYIRDNLRAELSAALQNGNMERDGNGERPEMLQRPESQLQAALDWQANPRTDLRAEVLYTGDAFDIADDGTLAKLPDATSLNLRGFYHFGSWKGRDIHVTASVDNLTDALILPQLGLPAPGRLYRIGIRIN